jgi:hypothetical protein
MGDIVWADLEDPPQPLLRSTGVGFELYRAWRDSGRFQAY